MPSNAIELKIKLNRSFFRVRQVISDQKHVRAIKQQTRSTKSEKHVTHAIQLKLHERIKQKKTWIDCYVKSW